MCVEEAMTLSQTKTVPDTLEWVTRMTPTILSKSGSLSFQWSVVEEGDAIYIPMGHIVIDKAAKYM